MKRGQPWIHSALLDSLVILLPSLLAGTLVWIFRDSLDQTTEVPLWAWVSFILCIDVAHVYSTLFRTYFNPAEYEENKVLLTAIPLIAWLGGVLLYSIGALWFWRVLAYVAVFHFIRQQYGFMMLYSRNEPIDARKYKWIDKTLIYLTTLYPVIYWHTSLPRNFHWFVDGDFVTALPKSLAQGTLIAYASVALLYVAKEGYMLWKWRAVSIPKQLIVLGTALSWYVGIVALNGDMAFTITNVVSHGIPYIGLIWIFGLKQKRKSPELALVLKLKFKHVFTPKSLPVFLGLLLVLAYAEEGLWAGLVWREHMEVFHVFTFVPKIIDHATLAWIVPLLALPQVTHYILDGFIWKLRDSKAHWQKTVFQGESA